MTSESTKNKIGFLGYIIFIPVISYAVSHSPALNKAEKIILVLICISASLFFTAISGPGYAARTGRAWLDQTQGVWLMKGAAALAVLSAILLF